MVAFHLHCLSIAENLSACLMKHQDASENQHWQACYDITVRFRCIPELKGDLSLELCFRDASGLKKVLIHRCENTQKNNHLLRGQCKLNVMGKISLAELTVTTSEMHMFSFIESEIMLSQNYVLNV
jgi:hypothetical protein